MFEYNRRPRADLRIRQRTTGIDGGQRPHVNVHVNASDLAEHRQCASIRTENGEEPEDPGDLEDLEVGHMPWSGPLGISRTRILACDCMLSTVLLDRNGAPLDVTPLKRLVSAAQRTALIDRDHGCAFPTCDAVPAWCDAHHIMHWAHGGRTVMDTWSCFASPARRCEAHTRHQIVDLRKHEFSGELSGHARVREGAFPVP